MFFKIELYSFIMDISFFGFLDVLRFFSVLISFLSFFMDVSFHSFFMDVLRIYGVFISFIELDAFIIAISFLSQSFFVFCDL